MTTPREIELKLEFERGDADRLRAAVIDAGGGVDEAALRSVYFDTADAAVRAAGFSLRVRHEGARRVQTVKSDATGAGLFDRRESECALAGDIPVLVGTELQHFDGAIAPRFQTEVQRTTIVIADDDAEIEIAIDIGEVRHEDRASPINEIELELRHGAVTRLFTLAREFDSIVPLRLGVLTKAERGYRLGDSGATEADAVVFDPATTVEAAFLAIMWSCIRHYRLNEPSLLATQDPAALHQARVALRRLRSALTLFKAVAADDRFAALRDEVRALAAALGNARDLDVLLDQPPAPELQDRLMAARNDAYAAVRARLENVEGRRVMLDIAEWLTVGAWRTAAATAAARGEPVEAFAADQLRRLRRSLKRRGADLVDIGDDERHEARIAAKKLRYATEFLGSLFTGGKAARRYRRFGAALEDLQGYLGTLNDMATAPRLLADLGLPVPAEPPPRRRRALLRKAGLAFDELIDARRFW